MPATSFCFSTRHLHRIKFVSLLQLILAMHSWGDDLHFRCWHVTEKLIDIGVRARNYSLRFELNSETNGRSVCDRLQIFWCFTCPRARVECGSWQCSLLPSGKCVNGINWFRKHLPHSTSNNGISIASNDEFRFLRSRFNWLIHTREGKKN